METIAPRAGGAWQIVCIRNRQKQGNTLGRIDAERNGHEGWQGKIRSLYQGGEAVYTEADGLLLGNFDLCFEPQQRGVER